ncbi:MAG: hypothetical protein JXR94_18500 [Candidatus Hydrogenedentes bacterium]|nr:hypothetical protein [Candidatus Hydrogenedentota bacterium]
MTSLERVQMTLRFEEPDRVPYFEQGFASNVASDILGREMHTGGGGFRRNGVEAAMAGADAHEAYQERYFADFCALVDALDFDVVSLPWAGGGSPTKKLDEFTYLFGDPDAAWAAMRFDPVSDTFHTVDASIRHARGLQEVEETVAAMAARHAGRVPVTADSYPLVRRAVERYRGKRAVAAGPGLAIPMEPAWLEAMLVLPEQVAAYTAMQADLACEAIDVLAGLGVSIIWGGGDFCANLGPVYSPAQFRQFMLEPLRRITARCHRYNLPYVFRTDGVTWPVARELFVESGVDGYGEIDKQAGMDLAELRARLPHLILWGNVDCGYTLSSGTAREVADETRRCIDAAAPGGGYLLGSSNVIHSGVRTDNVLTMIQVCRDSAGRG